MFVKSSFQIRRVEANQLIFGAGNYVFRCVS